MSKMAAINNISQTVSWIEPKLDRKHRSDIEIQNNLNLQFGYPIWLMAAWAVILKFLKLHMLPNPKSDWAQTWWKALGPHGYLVLLKSFCSDIQDGCHVSHFENLQISPPAILKVFNCYLLLYSKSDGAETLWKTSGQHEDLELLKWFRSDIQVGRHGSHLENLKITPATER